MSCGPEAAVPGLLDHPWSPRGPVLPGPTMYGWGRSIVGSLRSDTRSAADEGDDKEKAGEEKEDEEKEDEEELPPFKRPAPGTGKERGSDVPSWVKNDDEGRPRVGENGREFAKRILDKHHGEGSWSGKGSNSEYSQIQKYGDRGFQ